jgi:hypothetical protein
MNKEAFLQGYMEKEARLNPATVAAYLQRGGSAAWQGTKGAGSSLWNWAKKYAPELLTRTAKGDKPVINPRAIHLGSDTLKNPSSPANKKIISGLVKRSLDGQLTPESEVALHNLWMSPKSKLGPLSGTLNEIAPNAMTGTGPMAQTIAKTLAEGAGVSYAVGSGKNFWDLLRGNSRADAIDRLKKEVGPGTAQSAMTRAEDAGKDAIVSSAAIRSLVPFTNPTTSFYNAANKELGR